MLSFKQHNRGFSDFSPRSVVKNFFNIKQSPTCPPREKNLIKPSKNHHFLKKPFKTCAPATFFQKKHKKSCFFNHFFWSGSPLLLSRRLRGNSSAFDLSPRARERVLFPVKPMKNHHFFKKKPCKPVRQQHFFKKTTKFSVFNHFFGQAPPSSCPGD